MLFFSCLFPWPCLAGESDGKSCEMCFLVFLLFFGHEGYGLPFSADLSFPSLLSFLFVAADVLVVVCLIVLFSLVPASMDSSGFFLRP